MTPAQRSRFESLAIEWGAAFDIGPDQVRALNDRRLTDLCRCFAVIAENKRKVAASSRSEVKSRLIAQGCSHGKFTSESK